MHNSLHSIASTVSCIPVARFSAQVGVSARGPKFARACLARRYAARPTGRRLHCYRYVYSLCTPVASCQVGSQRLQNRYVKACYTDRFSGSTRSEGTSRLQDEKLKQKGL